MKLKENFEEKKNQYTGYLDKVEGLIVYGWAYNKGNPEERVEVVVLVDGKPVAEGVADQYREDLKRAGIGDGKHAFMIKIPDEYADGKEHVVDVFIKATREKIQNSGLKFWVPIDEFFTLFDDKFYIEQLRKKGIRVNFRNYNEALRHYMMEGWKYGLDPHPLVDFWYFIETTGLSKGTDLITYILKMYEDIKLQNLSPFVDTLYLNHNIYIQESKEFKGKVLLAYALQNKLPANFAHPHIMNEVINFIKYKSNEKIFEISKKANFEDLAELVKMLRLGFETNSSENILVSIIIINYKKPILTLLSALSALKAFKEIPHEIIIVDQESEPFQSEILYRYLEEFSHVKIITLKQNLYFGEGNNIAIDMAKGKYILFLNNDAFINEESAKNLLNFLEENEEYIAVGPVMLNLDLTISEIGGIVTLMGDVYQQGKGRKLDREMLEYLNEVKVLDVDYVSAACMLIRAEFLKIYGGFDYLYEPFYFEDTDLCMRIKHIGGKIACITNSFCLHIENYSTKEKLQEKWIEYVERSRRIFIERWFKNKNNSRLAIKLPQFYEGTKDLKIALYTPYPIILGGGENYLLSIGKALSENADIYLITEERTSYSRVHFVMYDLGIENYPIKLLSRREAEKMKFDIGIVMGNQAIPDFLLSAEKLIYHCQFPFPQWWHGHYFIDIVEKIDTFIVNSEFTKRELLKNFKRYKLNIEANKVKVIYPPINLPNIDLNKLINKKIEKINNKEINLISIGRFQAGGHNKRQDILAEVFANLTEKYPIKAYILGGLNISSEEDVSFFKKVKSIANEKVFVLENVDRNFIVEKLSESHIYVHGAGLGVYEAIQPYLCEHFGITVAEAISYGCIPVVNDCGGPKEIVEMIGIGHVYSDVNLLYKTLEKQIEFLLELKNTDKYIITIKELVNQSSKFQRERFYSEIRNLIK